MEVKHALAYLRLIASSEDDSAFLRVVNFPARGIGARSLEALQDAAKAGNTSLYNAVPQLAGKAGNALGAFVAMIAALRKEAEGLPLPEIVEHMLARSGLLAHFQAEKDGADRLENLQELVNAAALFVQEQDEQQDLAAFLAHAALEAGEHQAGEGSDALQLMTVHSAKGLEFQAVFVTGLEEGLFPHEQSRNEDDGLEEERRLMYVAITPRALAPVSVVRAEPHAARADALQRRLALSRRDTGRPGEMADAARERPAPARAGARFGAGRCDTEDACRARTRWAGASARTWSTPNSARA